MRAGIEYSVRVSYVTIPCTGMETGIDLNSPFTVLIEETMASFVDGRSLYRSSVICTSSPSLALRTRSIPHTGQLPCLSEITVGCIGQVYCSASCSLLEQLCRTMALIMISKIVHSPQTTAGSRLLTVDCGL